MKVTYLGHSGFAISVGDYLVVIDYFEDKMNKLPQLLSEATKSFVLSSHSHSDHFNPKIFGFGEYCSDITYLLSNDIESIVKDDNNQHLPINIICLKKGDEYISEDFYLKAYGSTDIGISFLMKLENKLLFHAGDLNNWHWECESSQEEIDTAENDFIKEIEDLSIDVDSLFLVMFPVDSRMGGDFAKGARQFLQQIKVENFIPMHTWGFWDKSFDTQNYENPNFGKCLCMKDGDKIII